MTKLVRALTGFPGSVLLIPMFISALINTFTPNLAQIGEPITGVLSGTGIMTLLFIMLFSSGMTLNLRRLGPIMKKASFLIGGRLVLVTVVYFVYLYAFGSEGIVNVSSLVVLIALCSTNPGIFIALISRYGQEEDISLFGPLNILPLPAVPLAILSIGRGGTSVMTTFMVMLFPFVMGSIVGNKWPEIKDRFQTMMPIILCFWGFGVGAKVNLLLMTGELFSGFILILLFYGLMVMPLTLIEAKIFDTQGMLTMSGGSVAAIALVIPQLAVSINDSYAGLVEASINQLALAVVISSVVTPLVTQKLFLGLNKKNVMEESL